MRKQGAGQVCAASWAVSQRVLASAEFPRLRAHSREKLLEEDPGGPSKVHPQRTSLRLKPAQSLSPLPLSAQPPSVPPTDRTHERFNSLLHQTLPSGQSCSHLRSILSPPSSSLLSE
ncbi:hypothetical protein DPEC_G00110200 [Dallia pectoralis]|uniref:Uncharacterized protein n=1 Tax=Dallia pectoralis TaxID=75939 RepID=A0ACC2GTE2_DALPE|nr:hypothetical protein DPEC_G00110200 [Dallia pectoralis]